MATSSDEEDLFDEELFKEEDLPEPRIRNKRAAVNKKVARTFGWGFDEGRYFCPRSRKLNPRILGLRPTKLTGVENLPVDVADKLFDEEFVRTLMDLQSPKPYCRPSFRLKVVVGSATAIETVSHRFDAAVGELLKNEKFDKFSSISASRELIRAEQCTNESMYIDSFAEIIQNNSPTQSLQERPNMVTLSWLSYRRSVFDTLHFKLVLTARKATVVFYPTGDCRIFTTNQFLGREPRSHKYLEIFRILQYRPFDKARVEPWWNWLCKCVTEDSSGLANQIDLDAAKAAFIDYLVNFKPRQLPYNRKKIVYQCTKKLALQTQSARLPVREEHYYKYSLKLVVNKVLTVM